VLAQFLCGAGSATDPPDWYQEGEVFTLADAASSTTDPVGVAHARAVGDGWVVELRALTVAPAHRGRGHGRRLLDEVANALRASGARHLTAAVPDDAIDRMELLRQAGFRDATVDRGATSRADDADTARDLVWFEQEL
jgi:ribosomal protein S18 acetylase RimI-like enzyme